MTSVAARPPAVAGVLWLFLFQPSLGVVAHALHGVGYDWNPTRTGSQACALVKMYRSRFG